MKGMLQIEAKNSLFSILQSSYKISNICKFFNITNNFNSYLKDLLF